ncbi:MAG TPA: hypothetical protein VGN26_22375 [Armatimonadota bacterium]
MKDPNEAMSRRQFLEAGSSALLAASALAGEGAIAKDDAVTEASLRSGGMTLTVRVGGPLTLVARLKGEDLRCECPLPVEVCLLGTNGARRWVSLSYAAVRRDGRWLRCSADVQTDAGPLLRFTDVYTSARPAEGFVLSRQVEVLQASSSEAGFETRFVLRSAAAVPLGKHELFLPGVCYQDYRFVPRQALAADLTEEFVLVREDRLPLPLAMLRDPASGSTVSLTHLEPDGATSPEDARPGPVVDERVRVASLGALSQRHAELAFVYPAAEGQRTYLRGEGGDQWSERFHPLRPGVRHTYKLLLHLSRQPGFPAALRRAWRAAHALTYHPTASVDVPAAYEASISLISDWSRTTNGAAGLPFRLGLPKGNLPAPTDINYQMGFVGQQLPLGYHLLRYGLLRGKEEAYRKGEAMVDFWAAHSLTPEGLPRTWYDTTPKPGWRRYNTFLRVASDGMVGALMAWDVTLAHGRPKPGWLRFCRGFGDWLVRNQNSDGSWYREYDFGGQPVNRGKQNTTHPVRYLVDLHKATGEEAYRAAALRAAEFCHRTVHQAFEYVGGTADNPNVMDKEAGFLAMDAFLALWDLTGEKRWLESAAQAGDFTETWQYSWDLPVPETEGSSYPKGARTTGYSIIATGHSGADLFLAGAAFLYYRLFLGTGDAHYAEVARQLLRDTKLSVDVAGSLGYGHPGLCTEALVLAPARGRGVNVWLPWLTYSMIEPITKLEDAYGLSDAPVAKGAALRVLRAKDRAFGRTRGLRSLGIAPAR